MKVKCKYCGEIKNIPKNRVKKKRAYYCSKSECIKAHLDSVRNKNKKRDFSQLKKLNKLAKKHFY